MGRKQTADGHRPEIPHQGRKRVERAGHGRRGSVGKQGLKIRLHVDATLDELLGTSVCFVIVPSGLVQYVWREIGLGFWEAPGPQD